MMANNFRLQNNVSYLVKRGYNDEQIAQELNIKPARASVLRKKTRLISQKKMTKITMTGIMNPMHRNIFI